MYACLGVMATLGRMTRVSYMPLCNLPPALLAEGLESFTCHCSNMGVNGQRIRVSTQSWLRRRKFSHHSCWDLNSQPFNHKSGPLTNKLSRLPTNSNTGTHIASNSACWHLYANSRLSFWTQYYNHRGNVLSVLQPSRQRSLCTATIEAVFSLHDWLCCCS